MKSHSRAVLVALATVGQFVAVSARAQAADSLTKGKANGSIAAPSAPTDSVPKKKGGMFGKLKAVASNKTVQSIAKAAVCTAVPGGQYMVGAAEAAKNKTSISSGVANSQSCIPGMGGAGMAGMGGLGGKGALANAAMGAAGVGAASIGGKPAVGGAKGLAGLVGVPGLPGASAVTGAGRMTAAAQGLAGVQAATEQMKAASAASAAANGTSGGEITTEASGEQMKLSGVVADEIKKGKLVIKKIDWVHGSPSVSAPMTQGFMDLMLSAGQAMKAAGANYRVDIYMDKKYSDEEIAALGAQRATVVVSSLQAGGQLGEAVMAGKIGKDKEQRVEIVKVK